MVKILEPLNFGISPNKNEGFKDCSLKFLLSRKPEYEDLIHELLARFPLKKKYLTIDLFEQVFEIGRTKTCRDLSWHVDGDKNNYLIWCKGQCRTLFLKPEVCYFIPETPSGRSGFLEKNRRLASLLKGEAIGFEIPDQCPVIYSSNDPHKGRLAEPGQKRIFLRLCQSDTIRPRNILIKAA